MFETIIGSRNGIYHLSGSGLQPLGLEGQRISAVHAWYAASGDLAMLAGSYGDGLFRSVDGGREWSAVTRGMTAPAFRAIVPDPLNPEAILCGTEPARAFRSRDGGETWQELSGITELADYEDWYLPYSPRAGALRAFYAPLAGGNRLLAAVEVGGLLESRDGGERWSYLSIGPDHDLHHITGHPAEPHRLYASLGYARLKAQRDDPTLPKLGGVARSDDDGASWRKIQTDYTRATIIPPGRPDLLLAGPALEVSRGGRIEVSADAGESWQPAGHGLESPMEDMVELFLPAPDGSIWSIGSGGRLLRAEPGEWHWRSALPAGTSLSVESIAFLPAS